MRHTTQSGFTTVAIGVALILSGTSVQAQTSAEEETLFERLGGISGIALVLDDFVDAFVADPVIMANPATAERKPGDALPGIRYQLITLVCEATGGPCQYVGPSLREAHDGLNVSEAEWTRMGELFAETLERHGIGEGEQQELFAILGPTKDDIVVGSE